MSISNSAMLVELNISVWTGQKVDRKATIRATDDARASSDAGQFKKNLMAGTTLRKELADYAALCRTWHNGRTLPWADKGARLLPTSMFFDYKQEANARQAHFNALRDRFIAEYPQLLAQAPLHLGDLFDPSDYPSAEEVASKFGFRLVFLPVAESGDFRIDVGNAELAELREQYESAYEVRVQEAMGTAWDKLHDALVVMSEKLTEPEGEKAMNDELVSMQNTVAGHKLAIKQMDKQAADERVKAAQEETQRLKEEEEKRVKNAADAAKQKLDDEKAAAEEAARQQKLLDDADARLEKERLEEEKRRQDVIDQFEKGRQMAAETRLANERKMLQAQAEFKKTLEENVVSSLNAIADIAGQNSKTAKAIALAQIAYDTGTGLMAALKNTQSTTSVDNQVTGGLAGLAKFAAISAVILTNSARAIRIVKSGNPAGGGNVPAPSPGRGVPQLQSAASSLGGGTQFAGQFDNRVYVTEGDITNTQRRVRQNRGVSVI